MIRRLQGLACLGGGTYADLYGDTYACLGGGTYAGLNGGTYRIYETSAGSSDGTAAGSMTRSIHSWTF